MHVNSIPEGAFVVGASVTVPSAGTHTPARATPDPDDFSCGFAVWNGSSFSAPAFAGELACLLAQGESAADAETRTKRAAELVPTLLPKEGES